MKCDFLFVYGSHGLPHYPGGWPCSIQCTSYVLSHNALAGKSSQNPPSNLLAPAKKNLGSLFRTQAISSEWYKVQYTLVVKHDAVTSTMFFNDVVMKNHGLKDMSYIVP